MSVLPLYKHDVDNFLDIYTIPIIPSDPPSSPPEQLEFRFLGLPVGENDMGDGGTWGMLSGRVLVG